MITETINSKKTGSESSGSQHVEAVKISNETWFKISDNEKLRPFFMNVVSDSNHWMFISSNGGLTSGRKNSHYALFPYYTDDKITESAEITGSKTILQVNNGSGVYVWEPFSEYLKDRFNTQRNLYKNFFGNKIMFEEINHDLGLTFRYQWNSSNLYGFVRKAELINHSVSEVQINVLDGLQNILPYGVEPDLQNSSSNLADAYKRSELVKDSGIGIFALSAIIVDKAEPSEALKANCVWSLGIENPTYLLSSLQLNKFRNLEEVTGEDDVKGEKGAYLTVSDISLNIGDSKNWTIVANVNQNQAQIIALDKAIKEDESLNKQVDEDIKLGSANLLELISGADGIRKSGDSLRDARHFSNVLFNIMRGGTFDENYKIEKRDFVPYLANANKEVYERNKEVIDALDSEFSNTQLYNLINDSEDADLHRLCKEYLPLKFSRRHGDPSRPWNRFSINTRSEIDGSKILDYEGNWRDIFQNWEGLVHSYPSFIEGIIFKFLNNSTFDGYNPYRVTKGGFDWETIDPDDPWSYIGYWGDHQIIYMLKLLEFYHQHDSNGLKNLFNRDYFVYANVPYRIKVYQDIALDPKNTIDFDAKSDEDIRENISKIGADGALLSSKKTPIHRVNFLEKILASVLAKVSNFIPEGGIWLNTQRPEWNDANNALVGNGVSMVTLYYLRRFLNFFENVLENTTHEEVEISKELNDLFNQITSILKKNSGVLNAPINNSERKIITESLGRAGSNFRTEIYGNGFSGIKTTVKIFEIQEFIKTTLEYLEHSIKANKRSDNLYHAYNLMSFDGDGITIEYLSEMLEGQVAVLSSGFLNSEEACNVLDGLRNSSLYRKDQNSYILYPNKALPKFLEKNTIPRNRVLNSDLLKKLDEDGNSQILSKDVNGDYHFNGNFRNASDLRNVLEELRATDYEDLVEKEFDNVLQIFEDVFNHKAFTGRSGTFFAYEGLGSIYWHMVSKLHLAVEEVCSKAITIQVNDELKNRLLKHFYEVGDGIGIHKSPKLYGAFPTDPYSHTPWHRGAQQPGMTGQVKEDILVHFGELGVSINDGCLGFQPKILRKSEFTKRERNVIFVNTKQEVEQLIIQPDSLFFSYCQVPVIYQISDKDSIKVIYYENYSTVFDALTLDKKTSSKIFDRTGDVKNIIVSLKETHLIQ